MWLPLETLLFNIRMARGAWHLLLFYHGWILYAKEVDNMDEYKKRIYCSE